MMTIEQLYELLDKRPPIVVDILIMYPNLLSGYQMYNYLPTHYIYSFVCYKMIS